MPATSASTPSSEIAHLARAMKAPRIRESAGTLAERARAEGWSHEQYLARVLEEEVREGDAPRIGQPVDAFVLLLAEPWPSADGWHQQRSSRCQVELPSRFRTPDRRMTW